MCVGGFKYMLWEARVCVIGPIGRWSATKLHVDVCEQSAGASACAGFAGDGRPVVGSARQRGFGAAAMFRERRVLNFALSIAHSGNEHAGASGGSRVGQHVQRSAAKASL